MLHSPGSAQSPPSLSPRTPRRNNVRGGADSRNPGKGRQIEDSSAKSCNNCRTRKVKCDSVHPRCGACVRRKQECIYGRDARFSRSGFPTPRRRHDNSNLPANPESSRPQSAECNYHVNNTPQSLFSPNSPDDNGSLMECDGINISQYPEDNANATLSEHGTPDQALIDERLENDSSAINPDQDSREDTDSRDPQIHILNFFHDAYGLRSATRFFRNEEMNQVVDEVRQARLIANAVIRRQQEQSIIKSRKWDANIDFDGVDPELALHLLDLHWNTCHMIWLVSYRPTITDSLFHGGPYVNKLLLNAIYYSSSLYSDRVVVRSDQGQRAFAGDMFYSRFCELIRTEPDQPCIPTAIALIICTASLLSRGLTRDCVELRDKAWRVVEKLECPWRSSTDKLPPETTPLVVEIEREMRARLYLGMFGLDTLIGLYLGQSAASLGSYNPMIKILDTFEELEDWSYYIDPIQILDRCLQVRDPAPSRTISTFMAQMSLYGIVSDVLRFFHSHTSTSAVFESSWAVKSSIEQQLSIWRRNLPSHLQFDLNPKPNLLPHHVALLAGSHAIRILIQRPFLEGKDLGRHLNNNRRAASDKQSADDVKVIWQLLIEYQQNYTFRRAPLLISFSAYTALMAVVDKRLTDPAYTACIESLWSILLELCDKSNPGLQNVVDGIRKEFFDPETNIVNASQRSEGELPNNNLDNMRTATSDRYFQANPLGPERSNASLLNNPMNGDELQVSSNEDVDYRVTSFVNLWCPKDSDEFPTWMLSAVEMMETNPLLRNTLRTISALYFGKESKDMETTMRGQQLYISVLGSVNHQLSSPSCNTSIELLVVVVLLAMLELYRPHKESSMDQHWMASLAILESRGPLRHITGIEHQVFTDLRYHWIIRCIRIRQTTFLSREEWKLLPWQGSSSKNSLHHLLDYVLDIPALLERFDQYTSLAAAGTLSPSEDQSMKASLFTWVDIVRSHVEDWKRTYAAAYPHGFQFEPPVGVAINNDQKPVFQYLSPSTNEPITPKPLFYPNITLAVSLITYSLTHLILFTIRPPANHVQREEQYSHACNISRSISYFFEQRSSHLVLKTIHPLHIAYKMFKEGSLEKKCVRNIFLLIGDRYHFDFFSSRVPKDDLPDEVSREEI